MGETKLKKRKFTIQEFELICSREPTDPTERMKLQIKLDRMKRGEMKHG